MNLSDLVALSARLQRAGTPFATATVVKKEGSTYRLPGARMIVESDGTAYGMVSGGCLESEVVQEALDVLRTGTAVIRRYDLTDENNAAGYGAGCAGAVHVLIEPASGGLDMLAPYLEKRIPVLLAHVIGAAGGLLGARQAFSSGEPGTATPNWPSSLNVHDFARDSLRRARSDVIRVRSGRETVELFLESALPPFRLILFGSGPDVAPLVQMGRLLGWLVEVVGARPAAALKASIPGAHSYTFLMHPEEVSSRVKVDPYTAAVIMNHNKARDASLANALNQGEIPYVGLLGPWERLEGQVGWNALDVTVGRVHSPVGLDIGAETPQEVALSIAAEVQAALAGFEARPLRHKGSAIHARQPRA